MLKLQKKEIDRNPLRSTAFGDVTNFSENKSKKGFAANFINLFLRSEFHIVVISEIPVVKNEIDAKSPSISSYCETHRNGFKWII